MGKALEVHDRGWKMNGSTTITIDGREYQVKYSVCRGSKAARENGQPISPDEPDHIDDMEVYDNKITYYYDEVVKEVVSNFINYILNERFKKDLPRPLYTRYRSSL
jgi:hypothetical protein